MENESTVLAFGLRNSVIITLSSRGRERGRDEGEKRGVDRYLMKK
jgi:hypothetical protein